MLHLPHRFWTQVTLVTSVTGASWQRLYPTCFGLICGQWEAVVTFHRSLFYVNGYKAIWWLSPTHLRMKGLGFGTTFAAPSDIPAYSRKRMPSHILFQQNGFTSVCTDLPLKISVALKIANVLQGSFAPTIISPCLSRSLSLFPFFLSQGESPPCERKEMGIKGTVFPLDTSLNPICTQFMPLCFGLWKNKALHWLEKENSFNMPLLLLSAYSVG